MKKILLTLLALTFTVSTPASIVNAAADTGDCDYAFYRSNRILWDDECSSVTGCAAASAAGITGGVKATDLAGLQKSDTLQKIFQDLLDGGMNAVQAAAVMGNIYVESAHTFAPDTYEGGVDTPASGYGIVQWTNNRPNYTDGRRVNLEAYARQQGIAKSNLDLQIRFLFVEYNAGFKARMADSAFGQGTNVADATEDWMKVYENPLQEGADPALLNSQRIPAAKKIYGFYSDLTPAAGAAAGTNDTATGADTATPDATTGTCDGTGADASGTADSAVAGSIVQTAIGYAWPTPVANGKNQQTDARDSYQQDKPKYAPEGEWSDCGAFVSTVMQASGVDTDFPHFQVHIQAAYVRAHPEKYRIIDNAKLDDIQPGDLLIENNSDHIEIAKGGKVGIDASNFQRVPSVRTTGAQWMVTQGIFIARYIGGNDNA